MVRGTYNEDGEAGLAGKWSMLKTREDFLRQILLHDIVESHALLGVFVGEVKRSVVLLDDVAGAAPRQVEVNAQEAWVLSTGHFLELFRAVNFEDNLLLRFWWHF